MKKKSIKSKKNKHFKKITYNSENDQLENIINNEEIADLNLDSNQLDFDYVDEIDKEIIEKVQIFGTDGKKILPILTDSKGRLIISSNIIVPPIFYKEIQLNNLETGNEFKFTRTFDISQLSRVSFIVYNKSSTNSVTVQLQDSPNESIFQIDVPQMNIEPNSFKVLTPTRFIQFQRIAYRSTLNNKSAIIDIFFQAQGVLES